MASTPIDKQKLAPKIDNMDAEAQVTLQENRPIAADIPAQYTKKQEREREREMTGVVIVARLWIFWRYGCGYIRAGMGAGIPAHIPAHIPTHIPAHIPTHIPMHIPARIPANNILKKLGPPYMVQEYAPCKEVPITLFM